MDITVLDAATFGDDISLEAFEKLGKLTVYSGTEDEKIAERISDAECIVANKIKLTAEKLKNAKRLKLICITATGYDNVDIEYCRKNSIAVCNVKGYSTESVAQLTVAMALSLVNHLTEFDKFVKSGRYSDSGKANMLKPVFNELYGKVWGIVGLGSIGKRVAEVAKALGCEILAFKRTPVENFDCVGLEELMSKSDIISVHLPSNEQTAGIIDQAHISLMKKNAVLINVSRGTVVDEKAIAEAVTAKKISGFGCDVYSSEPIPKTHPYSTLYGLDNVILTPHMAWGAYETRLRLINSVAENISSFIAGERKNRVV